MFGRRPDGRRLKDVDPIIQITPYLMPMRCDAQVFLQHNLDYEKMSRYIVRKSGEGEKITFMQILVAAYVRAVSHHPEVNRYIFNKQYYSRNNCSVSYTILKESQNHDSPETTVKINFDLTDTLFVTAILTRNLGRNIKFQFQILFFGFDACHIVNVID